MHADGVGVYNERSARAAQSHQTVSLLQPAQQQSYGYAYHSAGYRNHTALEQEYTGYLLVVGTQVSQCVHIVLLVYDEHRQRADDVEAGHDQYEREKHIGKELLYLHNLKRVGLLLIAVQNLVFLAHNAFYLLLHGIDVNARLEPQLK